MALNADPWNGLHNSLRFKKLPSRDSIIARLIGSPTPLPIHHQSSDHADKSGLRPNMPDPGIALSLPHFVSFSPALFVAKAQKDDSAGVK